MQSVKFLIFISISIPILTTFVNCTSGGERLKNVHRQSKILTEETSILLQDGKYHEAIAIIEILKKLHPKDPVIVKMYEFIPFEIRNEYENRSLLLGSNVSFRKKTNKSTLKKVLLYIPDRILDLADIFSLEFSVGGQLGVEAWITRGFQVSAYTGMTVGLGWLGKKQFGVQNSQLFNLGLGPFGVYRNYTDQSGTGGDKNSSDIFYLHKPSRDVYQKYQDYWSVGFRVGLIFFGFRFEVHPYEIYDFFAGIAGFDPGNDDLAKTDPLDFTYEQQQHLHIMKGMIFNMGKKGMIDYHRKYPTITQEGPEKEYDTSPKRKSETPVY